MMITRPIFLALALCFLSLPLAAQAAKPWLGVNVRVVDSQEARRLGISGGLKVTDVADGSPAYDSGLKTGDIILSAGENSVSTIEQMEEIMSRMRPGDFLSLGVRRESGRTEPLIVTLGDLADRGVPGAHSDQRMRELREQLRELDRERRELEEQIRRRREELRESTPDQDEPEPDRPSLPPPPRPVDPERTPLAVTIGASLLNLSPAEAEEFGVKGGVRVTRVASDGAASEAGLKVGDVVSQVNGEQLTGTGHFRALLSEKRPGETLQLNVIRDGREVRLTLVLRGL